MEWVSDCARTTVESERKRKYRVGSKRKRKYMYLFVVCEGRL